MRYLLAILAFALLPTAQACSIMVSNFDHAALDGDILLTDRGEDGVKIDLATGKQDILTEYYFPRFAATDGWLYVAGQRTLEADCTGEGFLNAYKGSQTKQGAAVDALDANGKVAVIRGDKVHVFSPGAVTGASFTIDLGEQDPFAGAWRAIAIGEHVAVSVGHGIKIYTHTGTLVSEIDADGAATMDWFGTTLVYALGDGSKSTFHIEGKKPVSLQDDGYNMPHIAAGKDLYLQHGDKLLLVQDGGTKRLTVPSGYAIANIAADADGAVVLVREAGFPDAPIAGILRLDGATFGDWLKPQGMDWVKAERPAFAWTTGPTLTEDPTSTPNTPGNDAPAPLALLPLLLVALRRRMA